MKNSPAIMIVEDDAPHRFMLDVILASWGYVTYKARNGPDALTLIQRSDVDLALMDIHPEPASGIEALKMLRSFDPNLPVILMTAYCPPETAREAGDLGANVFILKPIRLDELEEAIHKVLGLGQPAMPSTSVGG